MLEAKINIKTQALGLVELAIKEDTPAVFEQYYEPEEIKDGDTWLETPPAPFVTTWRTPSDAYTVTFPITNHEAEGDYTPDVSIDWGDDSEIEICKTLNPTHEYSTAGDYDISCTGTLPYFAATNYTEIIDVKAWGQSRNIVAYNMFKNCSNLEVSATDLPDFRNVKYFENMFKGAKLSNGLIAKNWDVSTSTSFGSLLSNCPDLGNVDLEGWICDSLVTSISMLSNSFTNNPGTKTVNLSNWKNTESLGHMGSFALNCYAKSIDMTNWDMSSVYNVSNLFNNTSSIENITGVDTWIFSSALTNYTSIFATQSPLLTNLPVSDWDMSNATSLNSFFHSSSSLDIDVSTWTISNVTDAANMFFDSAFSTTNYNKLLPAWATQSVQNNVSFHAGTAKYSAGVESDRDTLVALGWTITDGGPGTLLAASYDPVTFELAQQNFGAGTETCTHGGVWSPDHEGIYHKFGINEPVWEGYRKVENLFESLDDLDNTIWGGTYPSVKTANYALAPDGSMTACRVIAEAQGVNPIGDFYRQAFLPDKGGQLNVSFWVKRAGSIDQNFKVMSRAWVSTVHIATDTWQRFSHVRPVSASNQYCGLAHAALDTEIDILIWNPQCENMDGIVDKDIPSEYVNKATYFANKNGNTVSGGIVTEAIGSLLSPLPWLKYQKAATNYFQSYMSDDPTYWSISGVGNMTVTDLGPSEVFPAQSKYDLQVDDTGSYRLGWVGVAGATGKDSFVFILEYSGGNIRLTIRDNTAAVNVSSINLTPADGKIGIISGDTVGYSEELKPGIWLFILQSNDIAAGNKVRVTFYPSYSLADAGVIVHYAACHYGAGVNELKSLGLIKADTNVGVATDETIYNWAEANHNNAGQEYQIDPKLSGEDQVLLSIGGDPVLEVVAGFESNVIRNGTFDTDLSDWDIGGINPTNTIEWEAPGVCRIISAGDGVSNSIRQTLTLPAGKALLKMDFVINVGFARVYWRGAQVGANVTESGPFEILIDDPGTEQNLRVYGHFSTAVDFTVDNITFQSESAVNKDIVFSDGTNECSVPVVLAEPHIQVVYNTTDGMTLDVDGVIVNCPYDGSLGTGVISTESTIRRLEGTPTGAQI